MHPVLLRPRRGAGRSHHLRHRGDLGRAARAQLDARSRAFAEAAGFEPKPGRHLLLPAPDGALAGVLFALESADDPLKDPFRPGALAGAAARGRLPLRQCAARRAARARSPSRSAPIASRATARPTTRTSGSNCPEGVDGDDADPHRRGRLPGARPHQHAGQRHGAAGARRRRARAGHAARRERQRDRRRRSAQARISRSSTRSAAPPTARRA